LAQVTDTTDPILLSEFLTSRRSPRSGKLGFAHHLGVPSEIVNHRPDLISGHAGVSAYSDWLSWASRRIARGSGVYPLICYSPDGSIASPGVEAMREDELRRALIMVYREHRATETRRRRGVNHRAISQDGSSSNIQNEVKFLADQAKFLQRRHEDSCARLAQIAQQSGNTKLAIEQVENLVTITRNPESKAHYLLWLGILLEQVLDFEGASVCYGEAIAMEPTDKTTWYFLHNNMGYCLNRLGKYVDADWYCRAAINVDRRKYNAYKNLGIALAGQSDHSSAVRFLVEAIRLNPLDPRALLHLEQITSGHPELAEEIPNVDELVEECRRAVRGKIGGRK